MDTMTPMQLAESPWVDPWDGLLSGTYHFRMLDDEPEAPDHLVVYLRGSGGDANREWVATTTICGQELRTAVRAVRVTDTCPACRDGVSQAFEEARIAIADLIPSSLE